MVPYRCRLNIRTIAYVLADVFRVTIEYQSTDRVFTAADFPSVEVAVRSPTGPIHPVRAAVRRAAVDRARSYLARVPPAIAGEHGDVHVPSVLSAGPWLRSQCRGLFAQQQAFATPIAVLMMFLGLVRLLACANIATLMLARGGSGR
jgi:hypothetical protein